MLSELHNEYKSHPTKGNNLTNAVIFGNMAKKHLLNDLNSCWENLKFELNAWRGVKLSDFKPRIPRKDEVIESFVFTALLAFTLPLKLMMGWMNNGAGCGCNRGVGGNVAVTGVESRP